MTGVREVTSEGARDGCPNPTGRSMHRKIVVRRGVGPTWGLAFGALRYRAVVYGGESTVAFGIAQGSTYGCAEEVPEIAHEKGARQQAEGPLSSRAGMCGDLQGLRSGSLPNVIRPIRSCTPPSVPRPKTVLHIYAHIFLRIMLRIMVWKFGSGVPEVTRWKHSGSPKEIV